jgi:selT/selW/selH-like putative selenoprotein
MKSNYLSVKGFLEGQFPELRGHITGGNYPVPPILELLQSIVSMMQLAGMAWMVFGGQALFRMMGFSDPPAIYFTIQEYGTQCAIALFLLVPQLLARFATTGAFEVVLDGQRVIWSKLQEGRFPTADELTMPLVKLGLAQVSK